MAKCYLVKHIRYEIKTDYLDEHLQGMVDLMNSDDPASHTSCENCAYARQRSVYDKII